MHIRIYVCIFICTGYMHIFLYNRIPGGMPFMIRATSFVFHFAFRFFLDWLFSWVASTLQPPQPAVR